MANFTNTKIKNTYQRVVQIDGGILQDGLGNTLTGTSGNLTVSGSLSINGYSNVSASIALLETFSSSLDNTFASDSQLNSYTSSANSRLASLETKTGSLDTEQTTQDSRLSSLEIKTGSLDSEQTIQDSRLSSLETKTGSLDSEQTIQDSRLSSIELTTSSFATTGSNTLIGDQFISGNLRLEEGNGIFQGVFNGTTTGTQNRMYLNSNNFANQIYGSFSIEDSNGPDLSLELNSYTGLDGINPVALYKAGGSGSYSHNDFLRAFVDGRQTIPRHIELEDGASITGSLAHLGNCYMIPGNITAVAGGSTILTGSSFDRNIIKVTFPGAAGTHTVILPDCTAVDNINRNIRFVADGTVSANHIVTLQPSGSQTIDGGGSYSLDRSYEGIMIWSDGIEWYRIQSKA